MKERKLLIVEFFKRSGQTNTFLRYEWEASCLIYSESSSVLKEYNIARRHNSKRQ
jgi:hypothetical protein